MPVRRYAPTLPVIVLTSQDDEASAITALKSGAQDYLIKGKIDRSLLERAIRYAIERQQAALHVKSQNDFLLSVLESLTHPFIVVDVKARTITLANSAAQNEWFKEGVCCNSPGSQNTRPYLCNGYPCPVTAVSDAKEPVMLKHSFTSETGDIRTHEIHAFPVFDTDSSVKQVIVYILDITDIENSKRESQRLSKVVQQSSDSILIMDTTENIRYVNPAFEQMSGYSHAELLGQPYSLLLSQKHTKDFFNSIRGELAQGKSWGGVLISKKKDDTLYEEDVVISPVKNETGKIINFVSTSRDITSKKRLESIAEAANLMTNIGYIFSGIRHEIGNPINSIKMALTVLNNNIENYSIDMIKEFTERSLDEVLRVEYLLRALKNFSMYENLDIGKICIDECLKNFTGLIRDDFKKQNITIDLQLPPAPVYACADPRALHQVLLNLVTNAADALSSVKAPIISLRLEKKARLIIIYVSDNGCGMTAEERANLFKPFHTSKRNGTGLGLVIVKKMLSTMNSTIKVQSEKKKGTTVMIFIPEDSSHHEEKTLINH
jgi:PAS domain S-box-containing protein